MAAGVDVIPVWTRQRRPSKKPDLAFSKKIACQFTPDQFHRINSFADSKGISFAAAVRRLIFEDEVLP